MDHVNNDEATCTPRKAEIYFDCIRQRGKPGNVAVVTVMRENLLQLNAVVRKCTPSVSQTGEIDHPRNPEKGLASSTDI